MPAAFQRRFQAWIRDAIAADANHPERLVAIDGGTGRRSHDTARGLGALHIVSAWAGEEGIAPGQVATDAKSNEITAIPQLGGQSELAGTLITVDAMGCQKAIVEQVVTGGGDCVIAVKDDRPTLLAAIPDFFLDPLERDLEDLRSRYHETLDDGHGRIDERSYYLAQGAARLRGGDGLAVDQGDGYGVRITRQAAGTESEEVGYYLSSRHLRGKRFGEAVRGQRGDESMRWVQDENFREDESRARERTLGDNPSWLRRFAVTPLKRHPETDSLRGKMISCRLDTGFLTHVPSLHPG